MKVRQLLDLPSMAGTRLVAGEGGLEREVLWSHVVDMPDAVPWVRPGFMLLVSGYSWPRDPQAEADQIARLAAAGVAAIGLAVPQYVAQFSVQARRRADELALALIEIPWEVPFAQIMEELHRAVMAAPYQTLERSERIHRALTRAASQDTSLDDLAKLLASLVGRAVVINDASGKALAGAPSDDAAENADRAVAAAIRIGAEHAGEVRIFEGDAPLTDLDRRAAEHAALVAAIHISHQRQLAYVEARLGYASFLSLLESHENDEPIAEERVRLLGFDPSRRYRAGIVVVPESLPLGREAVMRRDRVASRVRDVLKQLGAEPLVSVTLNYVPFLLPEGKPAEPILSAVGEHASAILFGRAQSGAAGVRASYREALSLVTYARTERICYYEKVLLPRVIMGDAAARESFLHDIFAPLRTRKNGPQLVAALLALAKNGFRFRETAVALGIHPNTLRYRLEIAKRVLGVDLDDTETRFRLQLASRLLDVCAPRTEDAAEIGAPARRRSRNARARLTS